MLEEEENLLGAKNNDVEQESIIGFESHQIANTQSYSPIILARKPSENQSMRIDNLNQHKNIAEFGVKFQDKRFEKITLAQR